MEDTLKRIILENSELVRTRKMIKRDIRIPDVENIKILTGIRRCGKTFLLYQKSREYKPDNVLFLDFEDERLLQLNSLNNYDIIVDCYRMLFPGGKPVLFFDEIQSLNNWHLYLKRMHAAGHEIFVTGSNARLLSSEIATYLTGRAVETYIYPFSFSEYLKLKGLAFSEKDYYTSIPEILNAFDDYLIYGGFPEVIKAGQMDKKAVMRSIHELLLYKDLVAKYEKNDYLFQLIISKLVENTGKAFSIAKLANKIIPYYNASIPTITDYVHLLSVPFIACPVFMYRISFVAREMERKVYFQDNSFITQNTIGTDKSKLLENCVFNHLNRSSDEVFYYRTNNNLEVDFLVKRNNRFLAIQVSYTLADPETRQREIKALVKCAEEMKIKQGYILTYNEEGVNKIGKMEIIIIPVWKYLMISE
jgi:predicted AAA+ superfamily ATPase